MCKFCLLTCEFIIIIYSVLLGCIAMMLTDESFVIAIDGSYINR